MTCLPKGRLLSGFGRLCPHLARIMRVSIVIADDSAAGSAAAAAACAWPSAATAAATAAAAANRTDSTSATWMQLTSQDSTL